VVSPDEVHDGPVLAGRRGDVLVVTLNRADKRNALNGEMLARLRLLLANETRPAWASAMVLAGAGNTFAAGADIGFYRDASDAEFLAFTDLALSVCDAIEAATVPVVAAVDGAALGGGFELALACDWIVAAHTAFFGLPELSLGLIPGWGGTQRLTAAVGPRRAFALIAEGTRLDAEHAYRLGLVSQLTTGDDLGPAALERAAKLGAAPRRALIGLRRAVLQGRTSTDFAVERTELAAAFAHADAREGVAAFLAKRSPDFGQ
jgi:enoyl-CoA hydratase/carnithine racemase